MRSASAATLSQIWRLAVTFTTMWVIRREFLGPEELAVWMWVEPVFVLLSIARDLGVNGHLVRLRRRLYGNFLLIELIWGTLFALALYGLAPWIASFFKGHDQQTVEIVRVMAAFLWVQGLGLVPLTYFEAEHKITWAVPAELVRNTAFAIGSLFLVWRGFGVWAVVWAQLIGAVLFTITLWWTGRRQVALEFDLREIPELIRGSLPLALLSVLEQAVLYLDVLLLGLVLAPEQVGFAGLAVYALFFFSRLMADAIGRAVYPAIVAYRDEPEKAFGLYRVATLTLVCCNVPLAFFLHHNAEFVAHFLGGDRWVGAADYIRVAAFVPFIRPLTMFGREYLLVAHRDGLLVAYTLGNLLSLGLLGWWLVSTDLGALGMAIASYFPLGTAFLAWGLRQLSPPDFARLIREMLTLYGFGTLIFAGLWLVPRTSTATLFGASVVAGLLFLALCARRHGDEVRDFLRWA